MSSRQPSIFNFMWFMTFVACVAGLGVWAVGQLEQSPTAAARSRAESDAPTSGTQKSSPFAGLFPTWEELTDQAPRGTQPAAPLPRDSVSDPRNEDSRVGGPSVGGRSTGRRNTTAVRARPSGLSEGRGASIQAPQTAVGQPSAGQPVVPTPVPIDRSVRMEEEMALIPGGTFRMGSNSSAYAAEKPAHDVSLQPYWLDKYEVNNAEFAQFVAETHYVTSAEFRGWAPIFDRKSGSWQAVEGASWRRPLGPGSSCHDQDPVVQVSWSDAQAFAAWAGKRLPTEAEWEFAARGGLREARFPWGNDLLVNRRYQHNFWQGAFPTSDSGADGYRGLAPVGSYGANRYGVFDMAGNTWEWCGDWFAEDYYGKSPATSPRGPSRGTQRVQRGGSWLCVDDAMSGFLVYSRMAADPESMYEHVGFRCAKDAK